MQQLVENLSRGQLLVGLSIGLAGLIEMFTVFLRFACGYRAKRDTMFVAELTGGLRVHHLYPGLILCAAVLIPGLPPMFENVLIVFGVGLAGSDLMHHFLVLWPLTGSPEFDLTYPDF